MLSIHISTALEDVLVQDVIYLILDYSRKPIVYISARKTSDMATCLLGYDVDLNEWTECNQHFAVNHNSISSELTDLLYRGHGLGGVIEWYDLDLHVWRQYTKLPKSFEKEFAYIIPFMRQSIADGLMCIDTKHVQHLFNNKVYPLARIASSIKRFEYEVTQSKDNIVYLIHFTSLFIYTYNNLSDTWDKLDINYKLIPTDRGDFGYIKFQVSRNTCLITTPREVCVLLNLHHPQPARQPEWKVYNINDILKDGERTFAPRFLLLNDDIILIVSREFDTVEFNIKTEAMRCIPGSKCLADPFDDVYVTDRLSM